MENIEKALAECKDNKLHPYRSELIAEYIPFIISSISKVTGRFVDTKNSEELTIGMQAFDEAITRYEADKGSFINYASLLIRSRITDYLRGNQAHSAGEILDGESIEDQADYHENQEMKLEVHEFKVSLLDYGIDLESLVEGAPRHSAVREDLISLCSRISADQLIMARMKQTRKLPMASIVREYGISKRRLKRHRDFIIAVILIYDKKLTYIQEFLHGGE